MKNILQLKFSDAFTPCGAVDHKKLLNMVYDHEIGQYVFLLSRGSLKPEIKTFVEARKISVDFSGGGYNVDFGFKNEIDMVEFKLRFM